MEITKSITKVRKSRNYSQAFIANFLQTTQQQYSKYETGAQEIPVRHILKLSELYKVSTDTLLGINTFMTKEDDTKKFDQLYNEVLDICDWAEEQGFINEEGNCVISQNITRAKERIENDD